MTPGDTTVGRTHDSEENAKTSADQAGGRLYDARRPVEDKSRGSIGDPARVMLLSFREARQARLDNAKPFLSRITKYALCV